MHLYPFFYRVWLGVVAVLHVLAQGHTKHCAH